ncbi:MAG: glutaminyl-peptide cyclotransferase [SAR324 cluster bacterium]|nr:glutaminyl-peptide cyclotransferase [SAR324 cluster bacterium]
MWFFFFGFFPSCSRSSESNDSKLTPVYHYKVIKVYPHDTNAFTQGLVYEKGVFYEGTGRYALSSIRKVDLETGDILKLKYLSEEFFGEGLTLFGNRLIQLTWHAETGFVYDPVSFELIQKFQYSSEGWGLTHNGEFLIMSDGSATLHFLDPNNYSKIGEVEVFDQENPVTRLNELEYIEGEVWANVWKTDRIARISLETGKVIGWIELGGILDTKNLIQPVDVLNGIAYDQENKRIFVTGKLWPNLFEIEIQP